MATCSQTNVPVLNTEVEPCNGIYTPTSCIIHTPAITALGIAANTSLSDVVTAIAAVLNNQNILILDLTSQLENQQIQLEALQSQIDSCCPII